METNIVVDISPPIPFWQNSGSRVIGQNAVSQSNCRIFLNVISQEKSERWSLFLACRETLKSSTSWYYLFGFVQPGMHKVPQIKSLHIFAISPEKHGGWSWVFACKKHEHFLQVDSITWGLRSQTCPKHPKQ